MTINMRLIATYHLVHSLTLFFGVMLPLIWLPVGLKVAAQTGQATEQEADQGSETQKAETSGTGNEQGHDESSEEVAEKPQNDQERVDEDSSEDTELTRQNSASSPTAKTTPFKLPKGLTWETNDTDEPYGDPRAKKGGTLRGYRSSFPLSFRRIGPNASSTISTGSLIIKHPVTGNPLPYLATHWAVHPGGKTVYYRLNSEARWSDGQEVTSEDYVFGYELTQSRAVRDDVLKLRESHLVRNVKAHSPYIISVTLQRRYSPSRLIWLTNRSAVAKHFYQLDLGWTKSFDHRIEPTTSAYVLTDYKRGEFLEYTRQKDWWAKDLKYMKNRHNIDKYHYRIVRDFQKAWELFLNGELDTFSGVPQKYWHTKTSGDVFSKGYVRKVTSYTDRPRQTQSFVLNLAHPHWQDVQVRYALGHALDVSGVIDTVMRGDVERAEHLFQGYGDFTHQGIKARAYDPATAAKLMREAGWKKNDQGLWSQKGKPLTVDVIYSYDRDAAHMKMFADRAAAAGFKLRTRLLSYVDFNKALLDKKYDVAWLKLNNNGSIYPLAYHDGFHSSFAQKKGLSNLTSTMDKELDKLIVAYDQTFDESRKAELSKDIQLKIHEIGAVIPAYHRPYFRLLSWRYVIFPNPPGTRYNGLSMSRAWISDEVKAELDEAQKKGRSLPLSNIVDESYRKIANDT